MTTERRPPRPLTGHDYALARRALEASATWAEGLARAAPLGSPQRAAAEASAAAAREYHRDLAARR